MELQNENQQDLNGSLNANVDYKYQQEISQMMFVFGEVVDPQPAVLQLMEDIVRAQVIEMVIQSRKLASRRSSRNLSPEDFLFLIRYDRAKVNRLRTYLSWKDVRKKAKDSEPGAGGADADVEVEDVTADNASKMAPKQVKLPWEISSLYSDHLQPLQSSEHNNLEDLDEPDEDDIEAHQDSLARLRQADEATKGMTKEEYVHYSECRQASFTFKKAKKFREFFNSTNYLDVKPNDDIIDVLGFLAFEVVRELCIGAVTLKKQEEAEINSHMDVPGSEEEDEENDEEDEDDEDDRDDLEQKREEADEVVDDRDDGAHTFQANEDSNAKEKRKDESGLVGSESVDTAKAGGSSSSSNAKNKRKPDSDEQPSKASNKKAKIEIESSAVSNSPIKRAAQDNLNSSMNLSPRKNAALTNSSPSPTKRNKPIRTNKSQSQRGKKPSSASRHRSSSSDKGPFCSLFLPPENSDRPLLPDHVARAFSNLQRSKNFLQSSTTVMSGGGGLRRTKVFVM